MPITFVDTTNSFASASPISVAKPALVVAGDKIIAFLIDASNASGTQGAPAGWAQIGSTVADPSFGLYSAFYKDDNGAAGPYSFTDSNASGNLFVVLVAYRGGQAGALDRSNPLIDLSFTMASTNTGVTPAAPNETIISWVMALPTGGPTGTPSTNFTVRTNTYGYVQDRIGAPGGATGSIVVPLTTNANSGTWVLALSSGGHMTQRMVL